MLSVNNLRPCGTPHPSIALPLRQKDMTNQDEVLAAAANITDFYYGYQPGGACIDSQGEGGIPGGGPGARSRHVLFSLGTTKALVVRRRAEKKCV